MNVLDPLDWLAALLTLGGSLWKLGNKVQLVSPPPLLPKTPHIEVICQRSATLTVSRIPKLYNLTPACPSPRSSVLPAVSNLHTLSILPFPASTTPNPVNQQPWHFTMAPLQSKTNNSSSNRGGRFISASAYVVDRATMLKGYHYSATGADGKLILLSTS